MFKNRLPSRFLLVTLALAVAHAMPAQAARPDHVAQVDLVPGQESTLYRSAVIDPVAKLLYTGANSGAIEVSDLTTDVVVAQIPVPNGIQAMALDTAGHRLFAVSGGSSLFVIDTVSHAVTTVPLGSGVYSTDLAFDAGLGRIYVSSSAGGVVEVDASSNAVLRTLTTGLDARSVSFNPSTHVVYATSQASASDSTSTELCFFDPSNSTPTDIVPLSDFGNVLRYVASVNRIYIAGTSSQALIPVDAASHAVLAKVPLSVLPSSLAVSGGTVYAAYYFASGVDALDTATGQVSNLALGNNIVTLAANASTGELITLQGVRATRFLGGQITGSVALGASPSAVALDPARHRRYVASSNSQSLLVFADDGTAVTNIELAGAPSDVVVNTATDRVYVILPGPGTLVAVDAATNAVLYERPVTVEVSPGDLENLGPSKLALDQLHNRLYVLEPAGYVSVVDGSVDGATTDPVNHQAFGPFGSNARALAVDPTTQIVYLATYAHVDAGQPTERDTKAIVAFSGTSGTMLGTLLDPQTPTAGNFASVVFNGVAEKVYATTTDAQGRSVVDIFNGSGGNAAFAFRTGLSLLPSTSTYAGPLAFNPDLNRIYVYTGSSASRATLHTIDGATDAFDAGFDPRQVNGPTGLVYDPTSQQVISVSGSDDLGGQLHVYFDGPDTVAPSGSFATPAGGTQTAAILLTSGTVQASDDRSLLTSVQISLLNPDNQYWNGTAWVTSSTEVFFNATAPADATGNYTFALPTRAQGFVRGAYTLHARLTDSAGNVSTVVSQFSIITPGGFSFSQANYPVNEGGTVTATVQRDGGSDGTATVRYSLSDGTARSYETQVNTAGHGFVPEGDYRLTNDPDYAQPAALPQATFLLTFGPGVTTQTFSFPTVADTLVEGPQTIRLELEQVSPGAELGTQSGALVTINDQPPASAVAAFAKSIQILDGVQVENIQHMVYDAAAGKLYAQGGAGLSSGLYGETSVAVINTQSGLRESSFALDGVAYGQIGIDPALNRLYAMRLARGVNSGSYYSDLYFSVYDLTTHRRISDTELTQTHGSHAPDGTLVVDRSTHRVYALGASGAAVYNGQTGQFESSPVTTGGASSNRVGFNEKTGLLYVADYSSLSVTNPVNGSISVPPNLPVDGGIAINQTTGAVYAVGGSSGGTKKLSLLSGASVTAAVDLPGAGESATVDEIHNRVLVVESFSGQQSRVYTYDGDSLAQIGSPVTIPVYTQLKPPLAYVPDQQQLYLGNFYDAATADLRRLDLATGTLTGILTAAHPSETASIHTADYDKTYAASIDQSSLFVIDGHTDTLLKTVQLPGVASELTPVDSLGRLYFVCTVSAYSTADQEFENTNQIMALDCSTDTLLTLKTIDPSILSTGPQNQSDNYGLNTIMRADAVAKKLYVESTPYAGSSCTISLVDIDPTHTQAFHTVLAQRLFPASDQVSFSSMITSPVRHRLYLVESGGGNNLQRLLTLDGSDLSTIGTPGTIVSGSIFQNYPAGIAIDTAADLVYVQSNQEETYVMDVNPSSANYNQLVGDQDVRQYYGNVGYGSVSVAVNPVTHHAFVSDDGQDQTVALVMDGKTRTFTDTLLEIGQCEFLSVNPATQKMYAASSPLGRITVFNDLSGPASTLAVPAVPHVTTTTPAVKGGRITLSTTEISAAAGLKVRFQYQLAGGSDWTDLPPAARSGNTWALATTAVPAGDVVFRAVASATNDGDQASGQSASLHVYAIAPLATPVLLSAVLTPSTGKWTFSIADNVVRTTTLELQYSTNGVTYQDVPGVTVTPGVAGRFLITSSSVPTTAGFFRVIATNGTAPNSDPSIVYSRYAVDASLAAFALPNRVGPFVGARVISGNGRGQVIGFRAPEGVRETYVIRVANTSTLPDSVYAQADGGDSHFVIRYYATGGTSLAPTLGAEITSAVVNGTYSVPLAAGGSAAIIAEVITRGDVPRNTAKVLYIKWSSGHDAGKYDTVALSVAATDSVNTVFVTNSADSGDGSLRAALLWAQTHRGTTIEFEVPATDAAIDSSSGYPVLHLHPASALPVISGTGTIIDGTSQAEFEGFVSSPAPEPALWLQGDEVTNYQQHGFAGITGSNGLSVKAAGCQIRGVTVAQFSQGINITGAATVGTIVQRCLLLGNYYAGVKIDSSASRTLIGGATAALRNVFRAQFVAAHDYGATGVLILGDAHDNVIQGNFIGTADNGEKDAASHGFAGAGITVVSGLRNVIGGVLAGQGNVIGGSIGTDDVPGAGIAIGTTPVTITGNLIGCTAGLSAPVTANPNGYGIFFTGGGSSSIVGAATGQPNVISGNQLDAIRIPAGLISIVIQHNLIGLTPDGQAALPNLGSGIASAATSVGILANHLSGNGAFGIYLAGGESQPTATLDSIAGNVIGLGLNGSLLPNGLGGIELKNVTGVKIGNGTATGSNLITHNAGAGIGVDTAFAGNTIRDNQIFDNDLPGIDLRVPNEATPATPNDAGDVDAIQNYPVVTSVIRAGRAFTVKFDFDAKANTRYAIDLYLNLSASGADRKGGKTYLTTLNVVTPRTTGHVTPTLTITDASRFSGDAITATATRLTSDGSTSEYSNAVAIP